MVAKVKPNTGFDRDDNQDKHRANHAMERTPLQRGWLPFEQRIEVIRGAYHYARVDTGGGNNRRAKSIGA